MMLRAETWLDSRSGAIRTTTRREGTLVADTLQRTATARQRSALGTDISAVVTFVRGYRDALESKDPRTIAKGVVAGAPVVWLELEVDGKIIHAAVNERTAVPVAFRLVDGHADEIWRF